MLARSTKFFLICISLFALVSCASGPKKKVQKPIAPTPAKIAPQLLPEDTSAYQGALNMFNSGDLEGAKLAFERLIKKHPTLAGAYVNIGLIAEKQNDFPAAKLAYDQALAINPANVDALLNIALLYIRDGRFQEAETKLLEAEAVDSSNEIVQFNLGVLYELYLQDYDAAISHYENYVAISKGEDVRMVERWIKLLERK